MHGELAAEFVAAAGGFDGIDVADQVSDGHIRSGKLLDVTVFRRKIGNLRGVPAFVNQVAASATERRIGIVVDLASGNIRQLGIEQAGERPQDAALCLSAQPEQDEIVPREYRVDDLWNHGVFVSDNSGEHSFFSAAQTGDQILAQFVLHATGTQTRFGIGTTAQFTESLRKIHKGRDLTPRKRLLAIIRR